MVTPFIKWAGGKRSLLPELVKRMPKQYSYYYEPFLGGGSLFFEAGPRICASLSDNNYKLIDAYWGVKENVEETISILHEHFENHNEPYYIQQRKEFNVYSPHASKAERAARFIYLNKTCFNGLYRENSKGHFNVYMGDYKNISLDEENLIQASKDLQQVNLYHRGFTSTSIQPGAFYYFDPPYYGAYSGYTKHKFSDFDHEILRNFCSYMDNYSAYFMLSNSNTEFVKNLYKDYIIEEVHSNKSISCKSEDRGQKSELIIRNYE